MNVNISTAHTTVKLTKVAVRVRYDIPGHESGGLTWVDIGDKDHNKDGYLVEKDGKVIGLAYKWDDGKWTGQTVTPGYTNAGVCYAFGSSLYSGETRYEALAKIVYWADHSNYGKY